MRRLTTLLVLLLACGPKKAPDSAAGDGLPPLDAPLPTDPGVRLGQLDNGLRWAVETNGVPRGRAELRLVVRAGSVFEDDDQLGLAHFVEHMAFNGTEHFPGNSLIDALEAMGSSFGPHLNAYTNTDETVYMLQVPTDDPALLAQAMLVLRDWAGGLSFDPEEIEKERGVVIEEWRRSRGAAGRVRDALVPVVMAGSRYAERIPIGTEASLQGFDPDALRRFYRDWYRPDLMSVLAVGDFDPDQVQQLIAERFSDLSGPEAAKERYDAEIPPHAEPLFKVVTDPEVPSASFQVLAEFDQVHGQTHRAYREESLLPALLAGMVNERLADLAEQPGTPFLGAGTGSIRLSRTEAAWAIGGAAFEDRVPEALDAVLTEVERVRRYGFTPSELDRARATTLQGYRSSLAELETTGSSTHIGELVRFVTVDEPMPGLPYEVKLAEAWLPAVTTDEMNALAERWS